MRDKFEKAKEAEDEAKVRALAGKSLRAMYGFDVVNTCGYMMLPNSFIRNFSKFKAAPINGTAENWKKSACLGQSAFCVIVYFLEEYSRRKKREIAVSQTQLSERLGISKSTVQRVLKDLDTFGYVTKLPQRKTASTGLICQYDISVLLKINMHFAGHAELEKQRRKKEEAENIVDFEQELGFVLE